MSVGVFQANEWTITQYLTNIVSNSEEKSSSLNCFMHNKFLVFKAVLNEKLLPEVELFNKEPMISQNFISVTKLVQAQFTDFILSIFKSFLRF